jgi:hypothetical protein
MNHITSEEFKTSDYLENCMFSITDVLPEFRNETPVLSIFEQGVSPQFGNAGATKGVQPNEG